MSKKPITTIITRVEEQARVSRYEDEVVLAFWADVQGGYARFEITTEAAAVLRRVLDTALASADKIPAGVRSMDMEVKCDS